MFDLTSVTNWAEILGGVASAVGAGWKLIVAPRKRAKDAQNEKIKKVTDRVTKLEASVNDIQKELEDLNKLLKDEIGDVQKQDRFEIDELKKDYDNLTRSIEDRISKIDAKNDKLLDIIIKYFTENKD